MKKHSLILAIIFGFAIIALVSPIPTLGATKSATVKTVDSKTYLGRFILQTDSYNKLWYGNKVTGKRYFIDNDQDLDWLIDNHAKIISEKELRGIPASASAAKNKPLSLYAGNIVRTSTTTNAWYINPGDGIRYPIDDFGSFYATIKVIGLKLASGNLKKLPMNGEQLTYDSTFSTVAHVRYDGSQYFQPYYGDMVLPLASLTKLMTALVLEDLSDIDWNKKITITQGEIKYPSTLAQAGTTSEVPLKVGDTVNMYDLWVAMLTASSNQSAAILADNSGLTRAEFVKAMNKKAQDLGLKKTKFTEMSGLDPNNISTPKEFAVIAKTAFNNPRIADSTQLSDYNFEAIEADGDVRVVNVANRNYSLMAMGADASKTGFLIEAQRNVAIKKNGNIIVVMHALSTGQRNSVLSKLINSTQISYNK